jgi:hypothetical protein
MFVCNEEIVLTDLIVLDDFYQPALVKVHSERSLFMLSRVESRKFIVCSDNNVYRALSNITHRPRACSAEVPRLNFAGGTVDDCLLLLT